MLIGVIWVLPGDGRAACQSSVELPSADVRKRRVWVNELARARVASVARRERL
jgi:hypothetical protein